ncbi:integrase catalytic subunit, partial [Brevibacillus agri BAB-2500]
MLKVPQQQYIKFLYENEDYSISEIARAMGVN